MRRNIALMALDDGTDIEFSTYLEHAIQYLARVEKRTAFRKLAAVMDVSDLYFIGGEMDLNSQN